MSTEETTILDYLKLFPDTFISAIQICKRAAGRKQFVADPDWARIHLRRLEVEGRVESNQFRHYKLIDKARDAKKACMARCYKAITTYVLDMDSTGDEKPFATLLREAIQIAYQDPEPSDTQPDPEVLKP